MAWSVMIKIHENDSQNGYVVGCIVNQYLMKTLRRLVHVHISVFKTHTLLLLNLDRSICDDAFTIHSNRFSS